MEEEKNAAEPQESNGCPQESRVKGEEPSTESLEEVTNGRLATQRRTHRDDAYYPEGRAGRMRSMLPTFRVGTGMDDYFDILFRFSLFFI